MTVRWEIDDRELYLLMVNLPDKVERFLGHEATEMERDLKQSFTVSVSTPGGPPGVVTGELRSSVQARRIHSNYQDWEVVEGTDHAIPQEYGTHKMAARPHFLPAAERAGERMEEDAWMVLRPGSPGAVK